MADPIIARTIERAAGLRSASVSDDPSVIGIYRNRSGEDVFALEREGVRLLPDRRFIAYRDIEAVRIDPQVKASAAARKLILLLDGESIDLPIDGERGQFLDVFPIHAFLRRRAHQQRGIKLEVPSP